MHPALLEVALTAGMPTTARYGFGAFRTLAGGTAVFFFLPNRTAAIWMCTRFGLGHDTPLSSGLRLSEG